MSKSRSLCIAMVAGTVVSSAATAQMKAGPAPRRPSAESRRVDGVVYPDHIRSVKLVNGVVVPMSDWVPYVPVQHHEDVNIQYCFDAIQHMPGIAPGTNPGNAYTLSWTTGQSDYSTSIVDFDMNGIPAVARGRGATIVDFLFYDHEAATALYVTFVTADTFNTNTAPTDPSWGTFPGIQAQFTNGQPAPGFYFSSLDVSAEPPPVGNGWMMPSDGSGAYIIKYTRDAAGMMPAVDVQPGLYGTGNNMQPPIPKTGTQGINGQTDDETPPTCGWPGLAADLPNGIIEPACELRQWNVFGAVPPPDPTVLAPAIGFGIDFDAAPPPACYANCDHSTAIPFLNVNDFLCFQSKFAAGDSYANCDNSTSIPVLNVNDFLCFQSKFAAGCSAP